jgi:hypothetical protein
MLAIAAEGRTVKNAAKNRWLAVAVVATTIAAGCGSRRELSPVTGKVRYRDQPLPFGTVVLQPEQGQPATGEIQPDGTFRMVTRGKGDGASVGLNQVRIACYEGQAPDARAKAVAARQEYSLGKPLIPEKYLSYDTSGISIDVRAGTNEPLVLNLCDTRPKR